MMLERISKKLLREVKRPKIKVGDVVLIQYVSKLGFWKSRKFSGICIRIGSKGNSQNLILRNVISNIPVELFFLYSSNLLVGCQKLSIRKFKSVKRSNLYYIRNLKLNRSKV